MLLVVRRIVGRGWPWCLPGCVLPCLLASGALAAFEIAAQVQAVTERDELCTPGPDTTWVLRQWVIRHCDPGYQLLGERAAAGDRAAEAIRALHDIDPRGTRQRLATAVGEDAVSELYDRLGLAVPPLLDAVRAVLEAAPLVHLAASQPLAMAELDERHATYLGPTWDNAHLFCAAMRMTGFVTPGGTDGLVIQALVTQPFDEIRIELHRFGFAMVPEPDVSPSREVLDEDTARRLADTLGEVTIQMPDGEVRTRLAPHPRFGDALTPVETLMLALTADRDARDRVFLTAAQLRTALTLPAIAQPLFVLDSWHHPAIDEESPSDSVDLVLALEALRSRRAITASVTGKSRDEHIHERLDLYS